MRCKSCLTQCLESDTHCPHCRRLLVGESGGGGRSAVKVFGLIFAAVGAGAVLIAPTPPGLHANNLALAGLGSVAGGIFGAGVGLLLEWVFQKSESQAIPIPTEPATQRRLRE
jgi:hypothetical protein